MAADGRTCGRERKHKVASIQIEATVAEDGALETRAPEQIPGQRICVTIEPQKDAEERTLRADRCALDTRFGGGQCYRDQAPQFWMTRILQTTRNADNVTATTCCHGDAHRCEVIPTKRTVAFET